MFLRFFKWIGSYFHVVREEIEYRLQAEIDYDEGRYKYRIGECPDCQGKLEPGALCSSCGRRNCTIKAC